MQIQILIIIIALIVLIISLLFVYFNTSTKPPKQFPPAMSNCPDYWQINVSNGNCIIPSEDNPNSNLGNLRGKGSPIYLYNFNNVRYKSILSSFNDGDGNVVYGTPYISNTQGYKTYAYNLNPNPYSNDIPVGYYDGSHNQILNNIISKGNEINFNDPAWLTYNGGGGSICNIKSWVNKNNIVWDGLGNYNNC